MTPAAIKHKEWCQRKKEYIESVRTVLYANGVVEPADEFDVKIELAPSDPTVLIVKIPQQRALSSGMLRNIAKALDAEDYDVRVGYVLYSSLNSREIDPQDRLVIRFFLNELPAHERGRVRFSEEKIPRPTV